MSAVVYVNEAMVLSTTSREVSARYAEWAVYRHGVRGGGLSAWTVVECADEQHAKDVRGMLLDWGLPTNSVRLRKPQGAIA